MPQELCRVLQDPIQFFHTADSRQYVNQQDEDKYDTDYMQYQIGYSPGDLIHRWMNPQHKQHGKSPEYQRSIQTYPPIQIKRVFPIIPPTGMKKLFHSP
jgi:hypothetical protein